MRRGLDQNGFCMAFRRSELRKDTQIVLDDGAQREPHPRSADPPQRDRLKNEVVEICAWDYLDDSRARLDQESLNPLVRSHPL